MALGEINPVDSEFSIVVSGANFDNESIKVYFDDVEASFLNATNSTIYFGPSFMGASLPDGLTSIVVIALDVNGYELNGAFQVWYVLLDFFFFFPTITIDVSYTSIGRVHINSW